MAVIYLRWLNSPQLWQLYGSGKGNGYESWKRPTVCQQTQLEQRGGGKKEREREWMEMDDAEVESNKEGLWEARGEGDAWSRQRTFLKLLTSMDEWQRIQRDTGNKTGPASQPTNAIRRVFQRRTLSQQKECHNHNDQGSVFRVINNYKHLRDEQNLATCKLRSNNSSIWCAMIMP